MAGPILIDCPESTKLDARFLEDLGHRVTVCHGPDGGSCPMLVGDHCDMAAEASGIVFVLDLDDSDHRQILDKYRSLLRPDLPIGVVVKDRSQAIEYVDLLNGLRVWDHLPAPGDLDALAAEVEAIDDSEPAGA